MTSSRYYADEIENKIPILVHLLALAVVYLFSVREFLSDTYDVGSDNTGYNFPDFLYYIESIRHGFGLPWWYPYESGIPTGIAAMNMISLAPHRILGYMLYIILPLKPILIYKINVAMGMLVIGTSWWFFLYRLIGSRFSATIGCLTLLLGSGAQIIFTMEQDIATMIWIPWIMLTLIEIKRQFNYILLFAVFWGYSLTVHYPFHGLITVIFVFISLLLTGKLNYFFFQKITAKIISIFFFAGILCTLAASPSLYIAKTKNDFSSPVRLDRVLDKSNYEDYVKLSADSSAHTYDYTKSLSSYKYGEGDFAYRINPVTFALAIIGILYYRVSIATLIILALTMWATLGVNGTLPYFLFKAHFPFINIFRQWYHFIFMVHFCISVLAASGIIVLLQLSKSGFAFAKTNSKSLLTNEIFVVSAISLFLSIWMFNISRSSFIEYANNYVATGLNWQGPLNKLKKHQFLEILRSNNFAKPLSLFTYSTWWDLNKCHDVLRPAEIIKRPFTTRVIFNNENISRPLNQDFFQRFCDDHLATHAVIANIPQDRIKSFEGLNVLDITSLKLPDDLKPHLDAENYYYPAVEDLTPSSLHLTADAATSLFLVLPYNYKLGLKAYLDGQKIETYPVYDGAMIGMFVPAGTFSLDFIMPFSGFQLALLVQAGLFIFLIAFVAYENRSQFLRCSNIHRKVLSYVGIIVFLLMSVLWIKNKELKNTDSAFAVWEMNNLAGNRFVDIKGKNNADPVNIEMIKGPSGQAAYLNGKTAYIQTPVNFQGWKKITISFWVKPEKKTDNDLTVIFDNGHDANTNFAIQSADNSGRKWLWHCNGIDILFNLRMDQWNHVVASVEAETGLINVSVNGKKSGEIKTEGKIEFGSTPLTIGKLAKANERYFKGGISQFMIWNKINEVELP